MFCLHALSVTVLLSVAPCTVLGNAYWYCCGCDRFVVKLATTDSLDFGPAQVQKRPEGIVHIGVERLVLGIQELVIIVLVVLLLFDRLKRPNTPREPQPPAVPDDLKRSGSAS